MSDTIQAGHEKVVLTAVYTMSDGSTRPADDATWTDADPRGSVAVLSGTSGASITVAGADVADGSTDAVVLTVTGSGFSATAEVDIVASPPSITGITIQSSGPEPA